MRWKQFSKRGGYAIYTMLSPISTPAWAVFVTLIAQVEGWKISEKLEWLSDSSYIYPLQITGKQAMTRVQEKRVYNEFVVGASGALKRDA